MKNQNSLKDYLNILDYERLERLELDVTDLDSQLKLYRDKGSFADVAESCGEKNGIRKLKSFGIEDSWEKTFFRAKEKGRIAMLYLGDPDEEFYSYLVELNKKLDDLPNRFLGPEMYKMGILISHFYKVINQLDRFPFYTLLRKKIRSSGRTLGALIRQRKYKLILKYILGRRGLGYAFHHHLFTVIHRHGNRLRTMLEEIIDMSVRLLTTSRQPFKLYFGVKPELADRIRRTRNILNRSDRGKRGNYSLIPVALEPERMVMAVDMDGEPFRKQNGDILLENGGDGEYLQVLEDMGEDILFVQKINNICHPVYWDRLNKIRKKMISLIIDRQEEVFSCLAALDDGDPSPSLLNRAKKIIVDDFSIRLPDKYNSWKPQKKVGYLNVLLDRPIRVCAVIKSSASFEDAPYYTRGKNGTMRTRFVNPFELDMKNEEQKDFLLSSAYYNPVFMALALRDRNGRPFNLERFGDDGGYVVPGRYGNEDYKVYRYHGLFSGCMSRWNTILLEMPEAIDVKITGILDMLSKYHQGESRRSK